MRRGRTAAAVGLALSLAAPSAGADPDPIDVTVRGSTAGSFTAVASTDTAVREPIDAASMLDALPSVHVRRLGAEGSFASLSVRGSAPSQVGVFLDSIPLTSAADPAFDVGALPLWPGASFRVYRGFAPATLGTTGYLGGVLVIDPPSPALGGRTEAWAAAGSFGALKLRLGDLRRVGGVEIGSGVFASRSDGDFPYLAQRILGVGPPVPMRRENAGQVVAGAIERVKIERPWGSVAALLFADARRLGVPGGATTSPPVRFANLATTRVVTGLDAVVRTGTAGALRFIGWGRRETSDLADPAAELDLTHATTTKSAVEAAGVSARWRGRPAGAITLAVVIDGRGERFVPRSAQGKQASAPASRLAGGAGAEIDWRPAPRLQINASARADARRDDATGSVTSTGKPLSVTTDFAPTGHAGASFRFADAAVLSAHGGALSRPPGFAELYGNGASLLASPELRPERAWSADLGLAGDLGGEGFAFGYEVTGFITAARDLILVRPFGRATFRADNVARALLGGAEITASLTARRARMQVSYTLLFAQDQTDGRPLPGRPRHDLAYDASYRLGPVRLRYGVDLVSGVLIDGRLPLPPRVFHSAGAAVDAPFAPGLRLAIDIQNLFDQRLLWIPSTSSTGSIPYPVSDFLGYPLPGRTLWATLRFTVPNAAR